MKTQLTLAEIRRTRTPNILCDNCGGAFFKHSCHIKRTKRHFCSKECMDNSTGGGEVFTCQCGVKVWRRRSKINRNKHFYCSDACYRRSIKKTPTNAKTILTYRSYRNWKNGILNNAKCVLCESKTKLELHHLNSRRDFPELVREESNVIPICSPCHDIFHSNSSKGEELRGTLNAILAYGNPQPSRSNVIDIVERKVQRLTGEDITADKPDTRIAPERDDIVRAYRKL